MRHRFHPRALRAWFAFAALASLWSACSDEALAPPIDGPAATHPSQDLVGVPITRVSNRFAYLWANEPHTASYSPMPQYSYNATGGAIQIQHDRTGYYTVTIEGAADAANHLFGLSVVAYGATTIGCAPFYSTGFTGGNLSVWVRCHDRVTQTEADSRFSMLVVGANSVEGRHAFAWANDYAPDSAWTFTKGPNPIVISNVDAYEDNVAFGTGNVAGTIALLSPDDGWYHWYDAGGSCHLGGWLNSGVDVRCFGPTGAPWSEAYYVTQLERGRPGRRFGFAFANLPSTASYAPAAGHSYNSSGGAITVNHTSTGHYTIEFDGLQNLDGHTENVQVTPFGSDVPTACNVVKWVNSVPSTSLLVLVECRRATTWAYHDTKFNVVVIE